MAFRPAAEFEDLAEINITPLVDVMLVLLIIFIVTAPMLVQGICALARELNLQPLHEHWSRNDEDNQENEHHVHKRRDVDLGEVLEFGGRSERHLSTST